MVNNKRWEKPIPIVIDVDVVRSSFISENEKGPKGIGIRHYRNVK